MIIIIIIIIILKQLTFIEFLLCTRYYVKHSYGHVNIKRDYEARQSDFRVYPLSSIPHFLTMHGAGS